MIRVVCVCGRAFKAADRHAGKRTKCPVCGAGVTVGQTSVSSSSGGDIEEVPSWWYPSEPTAQPCAGDGTAADPHRCRLGIYDGPAPRFCSQGHASSFESIEVPAGSAESIGTDQETLGDLGRDRHIGGSGRRGICVVPAACSWR